MAYIHEMAEWPHFRWNDECLTPRLAEVRHRQGRLIGRMEALGFDLRAEANLETLTEEVVRSSEIEGEVLDRDQVRSSLARRLGMDLGGMIPTDRNVEGMVEMMLDATQNHSAPLTADRLLGWHAAQSRGAAATPHVSMRKWRASSSGSSGKRRRIPW